MSERIITNTAQQVKELRADMRSLKAEVATLKAQVGRLMPLYSFVKDGGVVDGVGFTRRPGNRQDPSVEEIPW